MKELHCSKCNSPLKLSNISYNFYPYNGKQPQNNYSAQESRLKSLFGENIVTLNEGNTSLISLNSVANFLGIKNIDAKLEFLNPTGSFKDRGSSLMISAAKYFGVKSLIEDSSGNAGASIAAYSARAKIEAHIFVPSNAPKAKIDQIKTYGARIHEINGTREDTANEAHSYSKKHDLTYASHNLSPFFIEGTKSFGYELLSDYHSTVLPDHIIMPVGNGSLFSGTWNGLIEAQKYRSSNLKLPKLHCIQSEITMPIVQSWLNSSKMNHGNEKSIAGGIAVSAPPRIKEILAIINESKGSATSVKESEILKWYKKLPILEGIFCEPTSATAFAGLEKLMESGSINKSEKVLIPITGSGLKDFLD
tara:strand:- start:224 stop:1312 length:1089 start_codon:yes stop_codon:yes gene_type:complete